MSSRKIVFSKKTKSKKSPIKKGMKKITKERRPRVEPHSKRPGFIRRESPGETIDIADIKWSEQKDDDEDEEVFITSPKPKHGVRRKKRLEVVPGIILRGPYKAFRGYLRDIAPDGSYMIELQATRQVVKVPKQDFREFRPDKNIEDIFIEEPEEEPMERFLEAEDDNVSEDVEKEGEDDEKKIDYKKRYEQHSVEDAIYFMKVGELRDLAKDLDVDVEGKNKSEIIKILDDYYQSLKPAKEKIEKVVEKPYEVIKRAPTVFRPEDAEETVEPGVEYVYKDVEIEYGDLKQFAMQLGLPMKESRLVPVQVQRYVMEEAELKPSEAETRMVRIGKYGILVPLVGAFRTIKPLGSTKLDLPEREEILEEPKEKRSKVNPHNRKYPRGTKVSFVVNDEEKVGLIVDFAKPGISVLSEGKTYKISYKNPTLRVMPKTLQQEYVQLPKRVEPADLFYARVFPESVMRKEVIKLFKEAVPAKNNVEKYEKEVYESLGDFPTVYVYLTKVLFPYLFIEGVLSRYAKMFKAKINNGSYTLVGCLKANLAHYLPELVMSPSFENDPQALKISGEIVSELLKLQNIWFITLFLRLMDPTRHKSGEDTIKQSFYVVKPLESLLIPSVINGCSSGGTQLALNEQGQLITENVPLGDLIICYDPESKVFNCSSVGEVLRALEKDPKNPISPSGNPYPKDFIKKFKKIHHGEKAPSLPKERLPEAANVEIFSKRISPKRISPKKALKTFPLRYKRPEKLDLPELQNLAKERGIKNFQKMTKDELVDLLSVKPKKLNHLTLMGNEFDLITLFADSLHFKVRGKKDMDIPISHDIQKDSSVVILSFDAKNYNEVKSELKKLLRKALKSNLDIYLVGVGDIVDVQKQVINRVFLKEIPAIRHIFFSKDDEDHMLDAIKNIIVDFTGKDIL